MASRIPQTLESSGQHEAIARGAKLVEYEEFIEDQLRKTRSHVRGVDIAAGVMVLLAGTLGFFLFAALVDHWLFTGGMGFWGRLSFLVVYLAGAGWWIATQIVPLLVKKINPLYAAYTIEHSRPSLKNSLVNFLLFRSAPGSVHARVLEAIEEQAATSLVGVSTESAVDRARLVRLGYVLVAIVAVCALYAVVSPKNPFKTIGRVVMPWADIHPPTQTVIDEIEPGNAQAFRGQQVQVKARVQGLPDEGQVILYYTTDDRQIVDRAVEMSLPPGEYRHVAVLPSADGALQQSLTYRIEAGDARTPIYSLDVVAAPTIVVRAVEYKYPDYTGLLPQRIEHQGDLKAIEGTEVTLEALANQDIASAHIDFDCNDTPDLPLRGEGTSAKTKFRLSLDDERQRPQYASYQLTFKNTEGERNPQPVKHQIDVTRDLSPEVQFVAPSREEIEIPLDGVADLEIVAVDPDFALACVRLLAETEGQSLVDEKLLGEPWRGQFVKKYRFAPGRYKLKTGDVVEYWATATDNKSPRPNTAQTARRRIRIVAPTGRGSRGDELAKKQSRDNDRRSGNEARPGGDELAAREAKPGEDADAAQEAVDQSTDSQDAASQRQQGDDQPGKSGEQNDAQQQNDSSGQGDQDGQSSSSDGKQGDQSGGKSDDGQSNDGKSGDGQSGQNQSSDGQQGSQQSGQGNSGQRGAEGPSGGDENSGQQGSNEQGAGEQGSRQSGSGQAETSSVPSDGTNDGEAFERILKHRDQQQDDDGSQNSDRQSGDQQRGDQAGKESSGAKGDRVASSDRKDSGDGQRQQSSGDRKGGGDQQRRGDENPSGGQQASGEQSGDDSSRQQDTPGQDGGQDGDTASGQKPGQSQPSDPQGDPQSQPGEPSQSEQSEKPQGEKQSDQPGGDTPGSPEDGQGNADQPGQQSQGDKPNDGQRPRGEGDSAQQQGGQQQSGQRPQQGDPTDSREPGASQDNNTADDGTPQNSDTQGQGAQSKDDPTRNADQQSQQSGEQRPDAKGGDGEQSKGNSGAGQQSNDQQGSPHAQESQQPREKSGQPGQSSEQSTREGQEQSPSNSKRESDSQGQEDGDRSGGGKKGGGQKSNQSGTGGAGQNTAADEGAGQSEQSGDGETSDRAGDDRESDGKTGQSGSKQGEGSESQSASGENGKPGGQSASGQSSGDTPPEEEDSEDSQSRDNSNAGSGNPQGGDRSRGQPPKSVNSPDQAFKPGQDEADQANLEYTRKATDLALEHLKHELNKQQPDQDLLDRLGWTREQAEDFVNRWEKMRQAGPSGDKSTGGRRELDETLRSLGLRPRGSQLGSNSKRDDRSAGYQESHRTTPPPEYSEAFKAYTQGTARGGK